MITHYGITIGPIFDTINQVSKTRAVWAASYLFSWFMKKLLEDFKAQNLNVILPYTMEIFESEFGAGLYGDRAYISGDEKAFETIENSITKTKNLLANDIAEVLNKDLQKVNGFLDAYLNIKVISVKKNENTTYPLQEVNQQLDHAELFLHSPLEIEKNYLTDYLHSYKDTLLKENAFKQKGRNFISIPEIAAATLSNTDQRKFNNLVQQSFKEDEQNLSETFRDEFKEDYKPYHKYFGVIAADGDNIGKLLEVARSKGKLGEFSKTLFLFAKEAEKIIFQYGGRGVYVGGDDLLSFVPSKGLESSTIDLIDKLDSAFETHVGVFAKKLEVIDVSMSYGVQISYIKHPLKEAISNAYNSLSTAKKEGKNRIAFCFQKHSGQQFSCVYDKSKTDAQLAVRSLLNSTSAKESLLSGFMNRLNQDFYFELYMKASTHYSLEAFFANFLNDNIHQSNPFIGELETFTQKVINSYTKEQARTVIFCTLRYLHFLKTETH